MLDLEKLNTIADRLEEIFWEAVAEGLNYEQAHDLVDDCVANSDVPGLVNEETEELDETVMDIIYSKVPTEEDYAEYMEDINYDTE